MFSKNLYNLRKSYNMTEEELAEKLGVYSETIFEWENGITVPDMVSLMKICSIFEVPAEVITNTEIDIDEKIFYENKKISNEKNYKRVASSFSLSNFFFMSIFISSGFVAEFENVLSDIGVFLILFFFLGSIFTIIFAIVSAFKLKLDKYHKLDYYSIKEKEKFGNKYFFVKIIFFISIIISIYIIILGIALGGTAKLLLISLPVGTLGTSLLIYFYILKRMYKL